METAIAKDLVTLKYPRTILCRIVFAFIFFFLVYYWFSNTLVHQLQSPVLVHPYVDITYWVFHLLMIPEFITRHYAVAWSFDLLLFAACVLSFLLPEKRIFIIIFFILYTVYYLIFNTYGTQHTHSKVGILLIPLPFIVPNKMFSYLWEATRYFALFIYSDAFLWKLFRLHFFSKDHGSVIVKKNFFPYLIYNTDGFFSNMYRWLLSHDVIIQTLFILGFILEGSFIIGFFTKRFDKCLFVISMVLPIGFLFLSDAFFFELLVLSLPFISFKATSSDRILLV